jgi:hypothetical protein
MTSLAGHGAMGAAQDESSSGVVKTSGQPSGLTMALGASAAEGISMDIVIKVT